MANSKSKSKGNAGKLSGAQADKILESVKRARSLFPRKQASELDKKIMGDPHGMARRAGFAAITMSGNKLVKVIEKDRQAAEAFAAVARDLGDYINGLEFTAAMMREAQRRIVTGLAYRVDMVDVLKTADALS